MRYYVLILSIVLSSVFASAGKSISTPVTLRDSLVQYAKTLINKPYRSGSKGPNGFDCSGYTGYVYGKFGMSLKASSGAQVANGEETDIANLQKGDLVFFKGRNSKSSRIGHVGIFLERNPDGSFNFIHSANGSGIRIDNSYAPYYAKRFVTACKVIPEKKLYKFTPVEVSYPCFFGNNVQLASAGTTDKVHKVTRGESLYTIAKKYHVSEEQVKEWNNLESNKIKPGQRLTIRSGQSRQTTAGTSSENDGTIHVVTKGESLYSIAKQYHVSEADLLKANNNNKNIKPGDKIAIASSGQTVENQKPANNSEQPDTKTVTSKQTHKVKPGETLSGIAEKYHTTSANIRRLNGISGSKIKPGSVLIVKVTEKEVPVKTSAKTEVTENKTTIEPTENEDAASTKTTASRKTHKVRKGETLSSIATKFGVTITQLKRWNKLSTTRVKPGTYLTVMVTEKKTVAEETTPQKVQADNQTEITTINSTEKTHVVAKGETLYTIAKSHNISALQIKEWNNMPDNLVHEGETLILDPDLAANKTTTVTEPATSIAATQPATDSTSTPKPAVDQNVKPTVYNNAQPTEKIDTLSTSYTVNKTHIVEEGETLESIADLYNVTPAQIKQWNGMSKRHKTVTPGQKIIIQTVQKEYVVFSAKKKRPNKSKQTEATEDTAKLSQNQYYIVKKGDNIFSIAKKTNLTVDQLKEYNHLTGTALKENQVLNIVPDSTLVEHKNAELTKTATSTLAYIVKPGDTLESIAKTHNISIDELKAANDITGNEVNIGQQLQIPVH